MTNEKGDDWRELVERALEMAEIDLTYGCGCSDKDQDCWIHARHRLRQLFRDLADALTNAIEALEEAQEECKTRKEDYIDLFETFDEQARADEEAMRLAVQAFGRFHSEKECQPERFSCWKCGNRLRLEERLKAREEGR